MCPPDPDSREMILECRNTTAGYGGSAVIVDLSLGVRPGEIVTIIGPNGSGKSTLLKVLAGHLLPESGTVRLREEDITSAPPERRATAGMGYVPQSGDVFSDMTVTENLEVGGYLMSKRVRIRRIQEVLETLPELRILAKRRARHLSGGERKLVALGRAMVSQPRVLLLDEPTAGLAEPIAERLMRDAVVTLRQAGVAVLLVEQRARLALEVSDKGYVLVDGEIAYSDVAAKLLEGDRFADVFFGDVASEEAGGLG
jgi:branched-chain amino acid transport system ATP-binding protein